MTDLKVQFATGANPFFGWINTEYPEVDVTKPLPYNDGSCKFLYASHLCEHLDIHEFYNFLLECRRILQPGGVIRLAVPDVTRIATMADAEYLQWLEKSGLGPATLENAVRNIVMCHGHKLMLTKEILVMVLSSLGFIASGHQRQQSAHEELCNREQHWRAIGEHADHIETVVVEGEKP